MERADPNEFINRFTGWFESTQNKFTHALRDSTAGDADNERLAQFFLQNADADNLVPREALNNIVKRSFEQDGIDVSEQDIEQRIQEADLKQDMVTFEEFLKVRLA